jgi:hypothetical protein
VPSSDNETMRAPNKPKDKSQDDPSAALRRSDSNVPASSSDEAADFLASLGIEEKRRSAPIALIEPEADIRDTSLAMIDEPDEGDPSENVTEKEEPPEFPVVEHAAPAPAAPARRPHAAPPPAAAPKSKSPAESAESESSESQKQADEDLSNFLRNLDK